MMLRAVAIIAVSILLCGCCITDYYLFGQPTITTPTPGPTATPTPSSTATSTPTPEQTATPELQEGCGPTITRCGCYIYTPGNYTLGADLTCDWGISFYGSASGSTFDCQGHSIRASSDGGNGIYAIDASDLTIRNCRFDGFYSDTEFIGLTDCHIENNTFLNGPNGGMVLTLSDGCQVTGNTATGNNNGFYLFYCNNTIVSNNTVSMDTFGGLNFGDSIGLVVTGNTLNGNQGGIMVGNCTGGQFSHNTVTSSNSSAILVYDSSGNRFESNTLSNGAWGIDVRNAAGNTFTGNTLRNFSTAVYCEDGLANVDGGSNTCNGDPNDGCTWVSCP